MPGSTLNEPVDPERLTAPFSGAFARYISASCSDFARLVECTRLSDKAIEIVTFEIDIGVPQRPVYAINSTETVSVYFPCNATSAPVVTVARIDFPDTPHQNLVPDGFPSVLCIDDRPWQDVRSSYTASELMMRIQSWFNKACEGELHGDDQPFDPFFFYDGAHEIIVTREAVAAMEAKQKLSIWLADEQKRFLIVTGTQSQGRVDNQLRLQVLHIDVPPETMKRMRRAPRTLAQLTELLAERSVDLITPLKQSILEWNNTEKVEKDTNWLTCILVTLPQIHPYTQEIGPSRPMAFICGDSPGKVGEALGVLARNNSGEKEKIKYVTLISAPTPHGLSSIDIQIAPVHVEADAAGASKLTGRSPDLREVVLIGAGSLGSHLAEYLAREGLFRWTVVDDDVFLPHNIVRHTLTREYVGQEKARSVTDRLEAIRENTAPTAIGENVLNQVPSEKVVSAFQRAQLIIDASASVPVARWLSDHPTEARRLCGFFTPDGRSAVLMSEGQSRSTTLRDLEAAYLREVLTNPKLKDHLKPGPQLRYTGACRALTNRIPSSSIAVLSGLIAGGVVAALSNDAAILRIWTIEEDGSIGCENAPTTVIKHHVEGWTISLPAALHRDLATRRAEALPSETGGPLVGAIDYDAKYIVAVHALAAPPDSIESSAAFIRGKVGLRRQIEDAQSRSGNQVRYIGEWHSHPPGMRASPSTTDIEQICLLSMVLELDGLPALSVIVGEDELGVLIGEVV